MLYWMCKHYFVNVILNEKHQFVAEHTVCMMVRCMICMPTGSASYICTTFQPALRLALNVHQWLKTILLISNLSYYHILHLFYISTQQSPTKKGLHSNDISWYKFIVQWASSVWQLLVHKANRTEKRGTERKGWAGYESISTDSLFLTGLRYALCEALLAFSETACASVKVLGEMSTTDTVVPTRSAVWNFTSDSGYWQRRLDKISPD